MFPVANLFQGRRRGCTNSVARGVLAHRWQGGHRILGRWADFAQENNVAGADGKVFVLAGFLSSSLGVSVVRLLSISIQRGMSNEATKQFQST